MFRRVHNEESGVALVTAAIVSMVIFLLCTVVIQLSIHNTERSADDRRRVQAVDAAEAGLDYYFSYLSETAGQAVQCSITKPMQGSPGSFTVQAFFYDSNKNPLPNGPQYPQCPPGPGVTPGYVMLYSQGKSGTAAPVRKMQAFAKLTVSKQASFDNAGVIFAQNSVNFTSNARLGGSQYSDADIYSNGSYTLSANSTIYGKVYAQGTVTLGSNAEVKKDIWTGGNITLQSASAVRGSVTAAGTAHTITMANNAKVYGDAKATSSITGGTVYGTRSPNQAGLPAPPTRTFPVFTYTQSDWSDAGYTIAPTFSGATACNDAVNYIRNTWTSGSLLVRIAAPGSTCTTTFGTNTTTNVYGNLAIISDGPVSLSTNARLVPSPSTGIYNMFLFAGLSGTAPCNITANANSGFNPGLVTLLYVPATCTMDLLSNSAIAQGQYIGGTINFKHTVALSYQPLTVPGKGIGGFKQDILYRREIQNL